MSRRNYIICIPSYNRAEVCKKKTLATLHEHNIDPKKIYVYVSSREECNLYASTLDKATYNKIVIGKKGLVPQRQFIMDQWPEHKHIVFIDDDIYAINLSQSSRFKRHSLDYFLKEAFVEATKVKSYIWGIYPVGTCNPFFMVNKADMTTDLKFIVGAFYGIINRPTLKAIRLTITKENSHKEDVERTLKYFMQDGIVLRFNHICAKTKYYGREGGGMGMFEDRLKPSKEASRKLKSKYPDYGNLKKRENGMVEFVLRKISARHE